MHFIYAFFLAAAFLAAAFLAGLFVTGLLFPKEPLKRLPFAVFLSPLPIQFILSNYK
jgi:hypothetical protein